MTRRGVISPLISASGQLSTVMLLLACLTSPVMAAKGSATIWGAGVKSCYSYNHVYTDWRERKTFGLENYPLYREWLMGLTTGLSAATSLDFLHGTDPDAALRRIHQICEDQPGSDFFNAAMSLFRQLSIPGAPPNMFRKGRGGASTESAAGLATTPPPAEGGAIPLEPAIILEPRVPSQTAQSATREKHPQISAPGAPLPIRREVVSPTEAPPSTAPQQPAPTPAAPTPMVSIEKRLPPAAPRALPTPTPAGAPRQTPGSTITPLTAPTITREKIDAARASSPAPKPTATPSGRTRCDPNRASIASNEECEAANSEGR